MVYALQKFRHYLLGGNFKMFTDHSALKYLVNKPVLGGRICRWLLLFQEYYFEIIVKPKRMDKGPDHLSRLEHGEETTTLEEDRFIVGFHRQVQKEREKAYHDRHIKKKEFKQGDLVLVYDNKFIKHFGKFRTHWLGPYQIAYVIEGGVSQFKTLNGEWKEGLVNGSQLKLCYDKHLPHSS
jgi:hypothetical protein